MTTDRPRTAPRAGWAMLVGAISLLLAVALCVSVVLRPRSPASVPTTDAHDPRRDYAGPFRNLDPAVQYVPDKRCADCHAEKARSFAEHPMGRSLMPLAQAEAPPASPRYRNPFEALGSQFLVDREQERTWHRRIQLDASGWPAAQ